MLFRSAEERHICGGPRGIALVATRTYGHGRLITILAFTQSMICVGPLWLDLRLGSFCVRNVHHQTALSNTCTLYERRSATPPCEEALVQRTHRTKQCTPDYSSMLINANPVDPALPIVYNICIFHIAIKNWPELFLKCVCLQGKCLHC